MYLKWVEHEHYEYNIKNYTYGTLKLFEIFKEILNVTFDWLYVDKFTTISLILLLVIFKDGDNVWAASSILKIKIYNSNKTIFC